MFRATMKLLAPIPYFILPQRYLSSKAPRVRFAPSPTGYLHLGGLRTALYNKLFAKSHKGLLILRIEDTDQTRKVEGSVDALVQDLQWAGIQCDEGPGIGGQYGPYVQSERLDIYQKYISKLLDNGTAYRCFCTERRLNLQRRDALRTHSIPKYDNRCRNLSFGEVMEKLNAGTPNCIRFKLSSDCQFFEDLIFGGIAYDVSVNEGDPVLMKSDGFPTYHFANVVDDYLMGISHVLRGVEWQISTTKHLLIYKAFGWKPPKFGHLPLIVNADGSKLSKRQSDIKVEDYRRKGGRFFGLHPEGLPGNKFDMLSLYRTCKFLRKRDSEATRRAWFAVGPLESLKRITCTSGSSHVAYGVYPLALVNYITLSGGGFDHVPGTGVRLKSMDDLAEELRKISSHPSRLNTDLLDECNKLEMRRRLRDEKESLALVGTLQQLVKCSYPKEKLNASHEHVQQVLEWATTRISRLEELVTEKYGFLWILPSNTDQAEINKDLLKKLIPALESLSNFDQIHIKQYLRDFCTENNVKFPILMKMLRSVLSGLTEGPGVAEMMQLLGKEQSLLRIKTFIE